MTLYSFLLDKGYKPEVAEKGAECADHILKYTALSKEMPKTYMKDFKKWFNAYGNKGENSDGR